MAKYLIGFMVRHIFSNLQYAFDHSASEGFDCNQIFPFAQEAIQILEYIVLYVGVIAGDGALSNRKYFNLCKLQKKENAKDVVFWTYPYWTNSYAGVQQTYWTYPCRTNSYIGVQKTYFISDISHLIKTTKT